MANNKKTGNNGKPEEIHELAALFSDDKPIIERIFAPGEAHSVEESIIGDSNISNITIRPEQAAEEIRNALVESGKFDSVQYIGDNTLEIKLYGKWYNVKVDGSLGNLFI